jgi:FkbM family methyltransferase
MMRWLRFWSWRLWRSLRYFGIVGTIRYFIARSRMRGANDAVLFSCPLVAVPLRVRPGTSDLAVFDEVLVEHEFDFLDKVTDARMIVDCGANVGYASALFLSRNPNAKLIAVEPDPDNFDALQANLAPFGERVELIRKAIWSHPARLRIDETPYRDGREWTRQVRECRPDEHSDLEAIDLAAVVKRAGKERISLLKMDIEGAEVLVFTATNMAWLDRVDRLVIELHDDSHFGKGTEVFLRAMALEPFAITTHGSLTMAVRRGK